MQLENYSGYMKEKIGVPYSLRLEKSLDWTWGTYRLAVYLEFDSAIWKCWLNITVGYWMLDAGKINTLYCLVFKTVQYERNIKTKSPLCNQEAKSYTFLLRKIGDAGKDKSFVVCSLVSGSKRWKSGRDGGKLENWMKIILCSRLIQASEMVTLYCLVSTTKMVVRKVQRASVPLEKWSMNITPV